MAGNLSTAQSYANPYQLFGFSMNKIIDRYLLKFDIAYKNNLKQNRASQLISADRLDWNIAIDICEGDRQWMLALISQYWLDYYDDYLTPEVPTSVITKRYNISYFARVSDTFDNSDLSWNLSSAIASNGDMSIMSVGVDWSTNDQRSTLLGASHTDAKSNSAFSLLYDYQRVWMEIKYLYLYGYRINQNQNQSQA